MKKIFTLLLALLFLAVGMGVTAAEPSLRVVPEAALPGDQVKLIVSGESLLEKEFCVYVNDAKDRCFGSTVLPKFVADKNNTVTFRVPESAKPGEYSLNVLVKESGSTASRVLSSWLQVNTASAQQITNVEDEKTVNITILSIQGCDYALTDCVSNQVAQGQLLRIRTSVSGVTGGLKGKDVQVVIGSEVINGSFADNGGLIELEINKKFSIGNYQLYLLYDGWTSSVRTLTILPAELPNPVETPKPDSGGIKLPIDDKRPVTPPTTENQTDLGAGVRGDVDCESLGLVYDFGSGLCLPADLVKGEQGSLAGSRSVGEVIKVVLNFLLVLAGVIAVLFMMIGGYQYLMSRGSDEMAKKGRSTMTAAIIGLVAVLLAWTVVNIVTNAVTLGTGSLFR